MPSSRQMILIVTLLITFSICYPNQCKMNPRNWKGNAVTLDIRWNKKSQRSEVGDCRKGISWGIGWARALLLLPREASGLVHVKPSDLSPFWRLHNDSNLEKPSEGIRQFIYVQHATSDGRRYFPVCRNVTGRGVHRSLLTLASITHKDNSETKMMNRKMMPIMLPEIIAI